MRPVRSRLPRQQRGAVLVEMAIILPVLTLLLVGIVNMGLLIRDYQVLQNAAREGARYSALQINQIARATDPTATTNAIKDRVVTYLQHEKITSGCDATNVTIDQAYSYPVTVAGVTVNATGSKVTVSCARPMLIGASSVTLVGESVFRNFW